MRKLKVAMIIIIVIIILLGILIFINKNYNNLDKQNSEAPTLTVDTSYKILENRNLYYTLQNNINYYFSCMYKKNSNELYSLLNTEFVKNNNITIQNVLSKIYNINDFEEIWIDKVYYKEIVSNKESQYYIKCEILSKDYTSKQYLYLIVNLNFENSTYSITPCNNIDLNKISYESIIENLKNQDNGEVLAAIETEGKGTDIQENNYNKFYIKEISDEKVVKDYIERYKINAIYFPDDGYNMLEEKYRNKKFENIEQYKAYTKIIINNLNAYKYLVNEYTNYKKYTNINKNNEKVIFKEMVPMQFTVEFDD